MHSLAHRPRRALALGVAIGGAVLAAATLGAADGRRDGELPRLERHELRDGRADLSLAPRSSSVFVFDERLYPTEPSSPAARDATDSRRWAGAGAGVATVILRGPPARPLPATVRVLAREPRLQPADDHVVDLDLLADSGRVVVSGTGSIAAHSVAVPPGRYRLRFAGQGYRLAHGATRLRIELWPRAGDQPPRVRRRWAGWTPSRSRAGS